jgi:hypothetical protein
MREGWLWRSVILFAAGTATKGVLWFIDRRAQMIDPLDDGLVALASWASSFGTLPGRGWETTQPPFLNDLVFLAIFLGGFGVECMVVGNLLWWGWKRLAGKAGEH